MQPRPPASAYAAAIGMPFAFGMSFVATKYALRGFEPLLVALLRFALAGLLVVRTIIWSSNFFLLRGYPDMCNLLGGLVALGCIML